MTQFNPNQGSYKPHFFCNDEFQLSKVEFSSREINGGLPDALSIFKDQYSFVYLRDQIKIIDAYDQHGDIIPFSEFPAKVGLSITGDNIYKAGKYLSRVFRPTRFGKHFNSLSIHYNNNHKKNTTDGISLISLSLVKQLGWSKVQPGNSCQFTLAYSEGLIKGHAVVSDRITSDVAVYTGNIKKEVQFTKGFYVALEPVKLGNKVRLDSQTLPNLWSIFSPEQYFDWMIASVEQFKDDLKKGSVSDWLDSIDDIESDEDIETKFTLQKAILHNIDYRNFPGLMRSAWNMFSKSLIKIAEKKDSIPDFRIPILFGFRGYARVDLRNHNNEGSFTPGEKICTLDRYGNLFIHPELLPNMAKILGGMDLDDNLVVIPLPENKAVIYRNPNQLGEYQIIDIAYDGIEITETANKLGTMPVKKIKRELPEQKINISNKYIRNYLSQDNGNTKSSYNEYTVAKTIANISDAQANVGSAANAEMILASIRIVNKKSYEELSDLFYWDLEKIIDSSVKDGSDISNEMRQVMSFFDYIVNNKIPLPKCFIYRLPERLRSEVVIYKQHPIDELYEAVRYVIDDTNLDIIGKGIAGKERIKGEIDYCVPPIKSILSVSSDNPLSDTANTILRRYNSEIAQLLSSTESLDSLSLKERLREQGIKTIQDELGKSLENFSDDEKLLITQAFMLKVYLSDKAVHDSIIWNKHIAEYAVKLLIAANEGKQIEIDAINKKAKRIEAARSIETDTKSIRIWSEMELNCQDFHYLNSLMIVHKQVLLGEKIFNIGDEIKPEDGSYTVRSVSQAVSKKTGKFLKNSLTIIIE